jgi:two-component system sensor histidine kinase KdpD
MVLLLSPVDPPESHLKMLGAISRMARDDQWRKNILSAGKSADMVSAGIRKWEADQRVTKEK